MSVNRIMLLEIMDHSVKNKTFQSIHIKYYSLDISIQILVYVQKQEAGLKLDRLSTTKKIKLINFDGYAGQIKVHQTENKYTSKQKQQLIQWILFTL